MTWRAHVAVTAGLVFAATGRWDASVMSAAGGILPDKLEGSPAGERGTVEFARWAAGHRRWSHWFPLYVVGAALGFLAASGSHSNLRELLEIAFLPGGQMEAVAWFGGWLAIGGVLHILEDAVTGRVPGPCPGRYWGRVFFRNGSLGEAVVMIAAALAAAIRMNA